MAANPCAVNVSQFEICKQIYTSGILSKFKLSPATKLVLIALANHYNPSKKDMFPSQDYLAKHLGISVKSIQRAVQELSKAGIVMYDTKRVNHYVFTGVFFQSILAQKDTGAVFSCPDKMSDEGGQIVPSEGDKLSYKQIKEQKKNQRVVNKFSNYRKEYPNKSNNAVQNNLKSLEDTRQLIDEITSVKTVSPMDDYVTAVNWLEQLTECELKHAFIRQRAEKIRTKWNISA